MADEDFDFALSGLDGESGPMDSALNLKIVSEEWDAALPSLQEFCQIPNLTVACDPEWATNGLLTRACEHVAGWVRAQDVPGCKVEVLEAEGLSPFLFIEIEGTQGSPKAGETFLMYGHLDKQPHGKGWVAEGSEPLGPTSGTLTNGKYGAQVYGRGASDDGYAVYSCIIAVKALQKQKVDHPRMVIIGETCEESGSPHLAQWVQRLSSRIGTPSVVYCLDSGIENYRKLWMTTSLRGVLMGILEVGVLEEGFHSGIGGGIVPDAFRVARQLLARVEDPATGRILVPELHTKIPLERQHQMKALAEEFGPPHKTKGYPWRTGAHPEDPDAAFDQYADNFWRPCMCVVGFEGLPSPALAGNVLYPSVKMKLSFRIPPLVDNDSAAKALKEVLEKDPPCGATVKYEVKQGANGWNMPEIKENLEVAVATAAETYFEGRPLGFTGLGGTIPLLEMLQRMFPEASLLCTGVLGPDTNMHGPNEMLPVAYTKKFTACVALIMGIVDIREKKEWPADVPVPDKAHSRSPKSSPSNSPRRSPRLSPKFAPGSPRFCFSRPDLPVGQCGCCL
mmetsp:Transcript_45787/g.109723  ORF Transcript_45787/g.109723 Transcript_45787/m.109723 type:complete len:564 (+) Transcript_45787:96-1787(+)